MREGYRVEVWENIINECDLIKKKVYFEVENGRRVRFWNDHRIGKNPCVCFSLPCMP